MRHWLGVVSADHVARGVTLGIAQIGHGQRSGLARTARGDGLVYWSPRPSLASRTPLRAFTAIGILSDDGIWQHTEDNDFRPWRRRVDYDQRARAVSLSAMGGQLELTAQPNWGHVLRRGLVPLSGHDFDLVRAAMHEQGADD